jgi:hypothetical protein
MITQCQDDKYKTLLAAQTIDPVALAKAELCQGYVSKIKDIPGWLLSSVTVQDVLKTSH